MRKLERMGRRMFDWLVVLAVILSVYSAFNAVHANIFKDQDQTERCGSMAGQVLLFGYSRDQGLTHADVQLNLNYILPPSQRTVRSQTQEALGIALPACPKQYMLAV